MLAENKTLEILELGHNRIRDSGLKELAEGIKKNQESKLRNLFIKFNFIREDGIIEFLKLTKENKSLKALYIKNN